MRSGRVYVLIFILFSGLRHVFLISKIMDGVFLIFQHTLPKQASKVQIAIRRALFMTEAQHFMVITSSS